MRQCVDGTKLTYQSSSDGMKVCCPDKQKVLRVRRTLKDFYYAFSDMPLTLLKPSRRLSDSVG